VPATIEPVQRWWAVEVSSLDVTIGVRWEPVLTGDKRAKAFTSWIADEADRRS
jgi:hypothetical protein